MNAPWRKDLQIHPYDHYADLSCLSLNEARLILTKALADFSEQASKTQWDFVLTIKIPNALINIVNLVEQEPGFIAYYLKQE